MKKMINNHSAPDIIRNRDKEFSADTSMSKAHGRGTRNTAELLIVRGLETIPGPEGLRLDSVHPRPSGVFR